jgi:hypothetical protein
MDCCGLGTNALRLQLLPRRHNATSTGPHRPIRVVLDQIQGKPSWVILLHKLGDGVPPQRHTVQESANNRR